MFENLDNEWITKFEEIQSKNEQRPKPETVSYQKAIEEAKLQKEKTELHVKKLPHY